MVIFQVAIASSIGELVYAILLEQIQDPDCFKRVGLVEVAVYHLIGTPKTFLAILDDNYDTFYKEQWPHCQLKEWRKDRWTEGTLKLF
jgi:hypothetical protein